MLIDTRLIRSRARRRLPSDISMNVAGRKIVESISTSWRPGFRASRAASTLRVTSKVLPVACFQGHHHYAQLQAERYEPAHPYFPAPNSLPNSSATPAVTTLTPGLGPRDKSAMPPATRSSSTRRRMYVWGAVFS